jgi:AraC family transcriptional regulator
MLLHIKNMVCNRCVLAVKQSIEVLNLHIESISLGEVELKEKHIDSAVFIQLNHKLNELGFEIIDDKKSRLIEQIKNTIIQQIHHQKHIDLKINWSAYLADQLNYEYNYLSTLFSSVEALTIEQYIIKQKVEKIKELIVYDELNISEIADKLAYSSVAHLSSQFKKITGQSPSEFKKSLNKVRKTIDNL